MLIILTITGMTAMFALTASRVITRIRDTRRAKQQLEEYRDFAASCAREVAAGARVVDAVDSYATYSTGTGSQLTETVGMLARQVRMGAELEGLASEIKEEELAEFCQLWAVARRKGLRFAPLADAIAADADAQLAQRDKAASAMAGARMTEILLLGLPVGAVLVGESMGLEPAETLLGSTLGLGLLLVGSLLDSAGVLWTEALTVKMLGGVGRRAGPKDSADGLTAAKHLDVFAQGLRAGLPVAHAWAAAATVVYPDTVSSEAQAVHQVGRLLILGAGQAAWEGLITHEFYGPIARQAIQQATTGTRLADGVIAHAERLRTLQLRHTEAAAERVLIAMAAPLTLCFLPAFVLVGLVPLVIGLAGI